MEVGILTKGSMYHLSGCSKGRKKTQPAVDMETSVRNYILLAIIGCAAAGKSNMSRPLRSHSLQYL